MSEWDDFDFFEEEKAKKPEPKPIEQKKVIKPAKKKIEGPKAKKKDNNSESLRKQVNALTLKNENLRVKNSELTTKINQLEEKANSEGGLPLIPLNRENLLEVFRLPRMNSPEARKYKLCDLWLIFRTSSQEIDELVKELKNQQIIIRDSNGFYSLP